MKPVESPDQSASVDLSTLIAYLDDYLNVGAFEDYGPNGLQVDGPPSVLKIVTGVSACAELIERATAVGADALIVHHGLFWDGLSPVLTGAHFGRIEKLISGKMSLLAYHLPLDAHAEIGNNALAAASLGLSGIVRFGTTKGSAVGFRGEFSSTLDAGGLATRCLETFGQEPLVLGDTSRPLSSGAIVSGAAQSQLYEAIAAGVDAFVTGEASEWVTNLARESGVCFVAAGHHATERLGVRALGRHLADRFGIGVEFIDVPNPV